MNQKINYAALKIMLSAGIVKVEFVKKNGQLRTMYATTSPLIISKNRLNFGLSQFERDRDAKNKFITVMDMQLKERRIINWNTLVSAELIDGEVPELSEDYLRNKALEQLQQAEQKKQAKKQKLNNYINQITETEPVQAIDLTDAFDRLIAEQANSIQVTTAETDHKPATKSKNTEQPKKQTEPTPQQNRFNEPVASRYPQKTKGVGTYSFKNDGPVDNDSFSSNNININNTKDKKVTIKDVFKDFI